MIFQHECHQIFPDVMNIALYSGDDHGGQYFPVTCFQQHRLQKFDSQFHGLCSGNELGQEIFALIKQFSHFIDTGQQRFVQNLSGGPAGVQRLLCQFHDSSLISL